MTIVVTPNRMRDEREARENAVRAVCHYCRAILRIRVPVRAEGRYLLCTRDPMHFAVEIDTSRRPTKEGR